MGRGRTRSRRRNRADRPPGTYRPYGRHERNCRTHRAHGTHRTHRTGGSGTGIALPSSQGFYLLDVNSSGSASWVIATQDEIGAGFSVSLALASGGGGPFEVGATWTPTFNATPATNAGTVENCSIRDNQGNTASVAQANPLSAPIAGGTYHLTSPGSVSVSVVETETSTGTTASSNSVGVTWYDRSFYGVNNANTATSATADGNNAELSDFTVLTGLLLTVGVGTTFPAITASSQYIALLLPHTASPHTFTASGFQFPMAVAATFAFVNQLGVTVEMDLYYSTSLLNATFTITVTS